MTRHIHAAQPVHNLGCIQHSTPYSLKLRTPLSVTEWKRQAKYSTPSVSAWATLVTAIPVAAANSGGRSESLGTWIFGTTSVWPLRSGKISFTCNLASGSLPHTVRSRYLKMQQPDHPHKSWPRVRPSEWCGRKNSRGLQSIRARLSYRHGLW